MNEATYRVSNEDQIYTPALLYYKDLIQQNTRNTIRLANGADRLWPHVKSHKMREMILMQRSMGIDRFKCATLAELRMVASCGAKHILMAYPLVGPNIERFLHVVKGFTECQFYAVGDDFHQLQRLSDASRGAGIKVSVLLDVNMGMNRTGVELDRVLTVYRQCAALPGIQMEGLHCYDGHCNAPDRKEREKSALASIEAVREIREELMRDGLKCELQVMGGTPSFPIHAAYEGVFLSPGTIFLGDYRYVSDLTDMPLVAAAAVMTRVISHPAKDLFTVDMGSKAVSTDMGKGYLLGAEGAQAVRQSEEHSVYQMPEGTPLPAIGDILYVIPMHICTTTALYDSVCVVEESRVTARWQVSARGRDVD